MIEKYGLFDSVEGDEREYAEIDLARFGRALSPQGVRGDEEALRVTASPTGLGVTVAPGLAVVQGRYYELLDDGSGAFTLDLSAASAYPRIDRIVLKLDHDARTVKLGVLQGTEAASPQPPQLVRGTDAYMLSLAQVRVAVGAGTIAENAVTDERADAALCGLLPETYEPPVTSVNGQTGTVTLDAQAVGALPETYEPPVTSVNGKTGAVTVGVSGAQEGHVAVFDESGNLVSSGKSFWDFTRAKMTLSGTTLTITTVS